jgi:hypothetical protein
MAEDVSDRIFGLLCNAFGDEAARIRRMHTDRRDCRVFGRIVMSMIPAISRQSRLIVSSVTLRSGVTTEVCCIVPWQPQDLISSTTCVVERNSTKPDAGGR